MVVFVCACKLICMYLCIDMLYFDYVIFPSSSQWLVHLLDPHMWVSFKPQNFLILMLCHMYYIYYASLFLPAMSVFPSEQINSCFSCPKTDIQSHTHS